MKTTVRLRRALAAGSLLALAFSVIASQAFADPSRVFWPQAEKSRAEAATKAPAAEPADVSIMKCDACKTVTLSEAVYTRRESVEIDDYGYVWIDIGFKHTCPRCGDGAITVERGVITNSMRDNCVKCGKDADSCSAVVRAAAPRT